MVLYLIFALFFLILEDMAEVAELSPEEQEKTLTTLCEYFPELDYSTLKQYVTINPETGEFKHYSTHDGLLSDQFSYHSGIKSRSGKLYFGTNRGFISFIPETFIENEYSPSLVFVDFKILKRQSSEDEQIFNRQVIVKNDIELPYKHNSFSIRFAVLNYYAPCRNEVLYTMKGMDKEWRTAKGNSSITFHNMKPGRYHLNAKLCGENTDTEDLEINILPPWWLSIWAKLTYVLLAVFLLYLGYLYAPGRKCLGGGRECAERHGRGE